MTIQEIKKQIKTIEPIEATATTTLKGDFLNHYEGCSNQVSVYLKEQDNSKALLVAWHYGYPVDFDEVDNYTVRHAEASCTELLIGRKLERPELVARGIWK